MTRHRILVSDADPESLAMLARYLELEGFDCVSAGDAGQVVDAVSRQRADAVLLDAGLPGVAAASLCRRLREHPATAALPLLVVVPDDAVADAVRDAGATVVIPRPYHLPNLAATLRSLFPDTPPPQG